VSSGVADLRRAIADAQDRRRAAGTSTILFIDEIHRFNAHSRMPCCRTFEDGTVTLIGATTENPSFEVVAPLLSAGARVQARAADAGAGRLDPAARHRGSRAWARGQHAVADDETLHAIGLVAGGDARTALNILELAVGLAEPMTRACARDTGARRRGRATPDAALRPGRGRALRHRLRVHQVGARL